MKEITLAIFAIACFGIASGQTRNGWQQKVAPTLLTKTSAGTSSPFIILLNSKVDASDALRLNTKNEKATYVFHLLKENAQKSQTGISAFLDSKNIAHENLFIVNAIKTQGDQDLIHSLAIRPDVRQILDDATVQYAEPIEGADDGGSRQTLEWGLERINADDVWALGYQGQGVTVGGEDTGYQWDHEALKLQYRGYDATRDTVDHNYNWHDAIHMISPLNGDSVNPCGLNILQPCDDAGHGTHTMGTMIGHDGDNEIGVAPQAKWCGCRNMERGWGSPFTYLECFQWFIAPTDLQNENPDPTKSPEVINNSWGCPKVEGCDSSNWAIMNEAVNNLRLAGTVVVVSAGNDGSGCSSVNTPAAMFEESFSVGATAINDTIAGFSSRGPVAIDGSNRLKPNVSAPGVNIRSAKLGGGYRNLSGTSMAGPHVVGLVALIISANPDLAGKVDLIENIIENTCAPKTTDQECGGIPGSQIPNNTYGFGRVDALAAVEAAIALIPTGTSGVSAEHKILVYPNPAKDQLMIRMDQTSGNMHLILFDAKGQIVMQENWTAGNTTIEKIDISDKPAGLYFYRITDAFGSKQGMVVKE